MFANLFKKETKIVDTPPIYFFNTASNKLEQFKPLNPAKVLIYSCGPTVYDYIHIGNLRSYVFLDILKRTLIFHGYEVENTINLTDFGHLTDDGDAGEDKMMKGLKREGLPVTLEAMRDLSDQYIQAFYDDCDAMRIMAPTHFARASEYVEAQIRLIETLDGKGYTYETSDGVYFDIQKYPEYGKLGHIDLEQIKSGARVEVNPEKRHPADFAVWKKGLLGWNSRWGKGFPGWHIECSAMAMATLGKSIDIHTGGIDHIPVHHNAEIAQSECATGKTFVNYWLHNAFITIDNTKISKSLGNSINLRHLIDRGFTGEDYRYWLLTAHYRSPVNFSWDALKSAKQALFRLRRFVYEDYKQKASYPEENYINEFRAYCQRLRYSSCLGLTLASHQR
ncbi:MAG: cysteine--tRNA ligase [Candidatus Paceibacterota bacterium]